LLTTFFKQFTTLKKLVRACFFLLPVKSAILCRIDRHIKDSQMIRNYLKTAFRTLLRSKAHSLINILGLGLGIACCLLIVLFVKDEITFDRFHKKAARIYRAYAIEDYGTKFFDTATPFPMGPALKEHLPEVEHMTRISNIGTQVKAGDQLFTEQITIAGAGFLAMFDFEVTQGTKASALDDQSNVLITESASKQFFGNADPIDQRISIQLGDRFEDFTVKAVLEDPPANSSIRFTILISDLNYPRLYSERLLTSAWFNIAPETYVLLREGVDAGKLQEKFPSVFKPLLGEDYEKSKYFVGLQPLTSIHLDTSFPPAIAPVSDPKYSYILGAIALLILAVACINFVTLSVGRSLQRAKEVGIRKVAGAARQQLIFQFIGEAVIITFIALVLGLVVAVVSLPLFNDLSGKQLSLHVDGFIMLVIFSLVLVIGCIAGSYPAFVLSGFKPITVLKGALQTGRSKQTLRKALVGLQLVLSIFLISSTLLMKKQLNFLQSKNLGFDREQLIVVQLNVAGGGRLRDRIPLGFAKAEQFKAELSRINQISSVCASSHDFGNGQWANLGYTDEQGIYRTFFYNSVDVDYIKTLNIKLTAGRNFSDDVPSDKRRAIIINQAFANVYGWTNPIGKRIPGKNFEEHEVIGVVEDFNYASLYTRVEPLVIAMDPIVVFSGIENINTDNSLIPKLIIRLRPGNAAAIEQIKGVWDKLTGGEEFGFNFVDQALDAQYENDQNLGKIVSIATLLAIFIGSLGLYGLASLAMQNRIKEISIRKVLGATERSLLILLSRDYVYLITISLVLSVPITWYLVSSWLTTFEYRITIGAESFLIAGGISLLIALITISYQAIKTAWSQPAETLKYE
jgi:putative ABC transport system permease protein